MTCIASLRCILAGWPSVAPHNNIVTIHIQTQYKIHSSNRTLPLREVGIKHSPRLSDAKKHVCVFECIYMDGAADGFNAWPNFESCVWLDAGSPLPVGKNFGQRYSLWIEQHSRTNLLLDFDRRQRRKNECLHVAIVNTTVFVVNEMKMGITIIETGSDFAPSRFFIQHIYMKIGGHVGEFLHIWLLIPDAQLKTKFSVLMMSCE